MSISQHAKKTVLYLINRCGPSATQGRRLARVRHFVGLFKKAKYWTADRIWLPRRHAIAERDAALEGLRVKRQHAEDGRAKNRGGKVRAFLSSNTTPLDKLKVAIFIPSFLNGAGGAEKVAAQVAETFVAAGAAVVLLCRAANGDQQAYKIDERIKIRSFSEQDDEQIAMLRDDGFDVLVCFGMPHFFRRIPHVAEMLGVPFVVQECTNPKEMTRSLLELTDCRTEEEAYWMRQSVFAHAAATRFTNPSHCETVIEELKPFCYGFYNAFPLPSCNVHLDLEPNSIRKVICVGAMKNENKNGMAAVTAFCEFTQDHDNWSLELYGENGYPDALRRAIALNPQAAISDNGIERDINRIYSDAYALVIPSFEEGLPNVVLEAFSYGVPCIGFSDCSAVAHLVHHGKNGLLVDRNDTNGLKNALEMLTDVSLRNKLGKNARKFAESHFQIEEWKRNWLQLTHNAAHGLNKNGHLQPAVALGDVGKNTSPWRRLLRSHRAIA